MSKPIDLIKKLVVGNRIFAPIYFNIFIPYFTYKFIKQINENLVFDFNDPESLDWQTRIKEVIACPDNKYIIRCENAGRIISNRLIMHNGIKVHPLSYYGKYMLKLLIDNRGVHEPQEERAFQEVLKEIPENGIMMELGCYWAFYSLWFKMKMKGSQTYLIEPNPLCLQSGRMNFRINKVKGEFFNAYIGNTFIDADVPTVTVDYLVEKYNIDHIHILHSDIQGSELEMLQGSSKTISDGKVSYFFISTHSDDLHEQCIGFLKSRDYQIIASSNCSNSYSVDGIIVAKASYVFKPEKIDIALRK